MQQPDTLMMLAVILLFLGIIFTVGAALSDAITYWQERRHNLRRSQATRRK